MHGPIIWTMSGHPATPSHGCSGGADVTALASGGHLLQHPQRSTTGRRLMMRGERQPSYRANAEATTTGGLISSVSRPLAINVLTDGGWAAPRAVVGESRERMYTRTRPNCVVAGPVGARSTTTGSSATTYLVIGVRHASSIDRQREIKWQGAAGGA